MQPGCLPGGAGSIPVSPALGPQRRGIKDATPGRGPDKPPPKDGTPDYEFGREGSSPSGGTKRARLMTVGDESAWAHPPARFSWCPWCRGSAHQVVALKVPDRYRADTPKASQANKVPLPEVCKAK